MDTLLAIVHVAWMWIAVVYIIMIDNKTKKLEERINKLENSQE